MFSPPRCEVGQFGNMPSSMSGSWPSFCCEKLQKLCWTQKCKETALTFESHLYTYCYLTINSTDSESSLPICPLLLNLDTDQIIAFHFYIRSSTNGLSAQQLRLLVCREMSSKDGVTSLKNHVRILCYGSGFEYDSKSSDLEPGYIFRLDISMF